MSFSFAVEAPVEMEQKLNLIGQGWKKAETAICPPKVAKKRDVKTNDKKIMSSIEND